MKNYEVLNELVPKTQELHREIFDKGYKQGVNDGSLDVKMRVDGAYEKGLNDAWECVRKIVTFRTPEEWDSFYDFMEVANYINIFEKYSASEAIVKINEYEEKQKHADDEIKVGDIVESIYGTNIGKKYLVTHVISKNYIGVASHDGEVGFINSDNFKKTGRTFPKIFKVLEQLNEEE